MGSIDVTEILGYGAIGLGFLLALLAYRLLAKEQGKDVPNESILKAIKTYMLFAVVLVLIGATVQVIGPISSPSDSGSQESARLDFRDYFARARIDLAYAANPETSKFGNLEELGKATVRLNLPPGACKQYLAVVGPENESDMSWWSNGPGARDVNIQPTSESPNIKSGRVCTSEDQARPAEVGLVLKMTRGSGPYGFETYFISQRIYEN